MTYKTSIYFIFETFELFFFFQSFFKGGSIYDLKEFADQIVSVWHNEWFKKEEKKMLQYGQGLESNMFS